MQNKIRLKDVVVAEWEWETRIEMCECTAAQIPRAERLLKGQICTAMQLRRRMMIIIICDGVVHVVLCLWWWMWMCFARVECHAIGT